MARNGTHGSGTETREGTASVPATATAAPISAGSFFSVIITAYNRPKFLPEAIDSVLGQSVPRTDYEIIVVKNFEDEESDRRIRENGLIGLYRTEKALGIHLRAALDRARGQVVALLNDDDLWEPDRLRVVRERFESDPRLGFHATSYTVVDEENRPFPASGTGSRPSRASRRTPESSTASGPAPLRRTSTASFGRTPGATVRSRSGRRRCAVTSRSSPTCPPRWTRSC